VCLLTVSASSHPLFRCISAPILRYAREVWVSTRVPEDLKPGDILTPQEYVGIWWAVKHMAPRAYQGTSGCTLPYWLAVHRPRDHGYRLGYHTRPHSRNPGHA
jgi:hypothetical protein